MFEKGTRVSLKSNPQIKGTIKSSFIYGDQNIYELIFEDGSVRSKSELEIIPEIINKDSWELLAQDIFADPDEFKISSILNKIDNKVLNTVSILKASRTIFKPYQYKPLMKFLNSDNKNLLIADEVGLGKTIEAGHILLESILRGEVKNCLIVCKKSLIEKWKIELQEKFNIHFKTYDTVKSFKSDIRDEAESRTKSLMVIANYERLRDKELKEIFEENDYSFDMVILDEAQTIRNQETQVHKGSSFIIERAGATIMLSATPIMTSLDNLHSLVKLLEPNYESNSAFRWAIELNKPFIKAQNNINNGMSLEEVWDELNEELVSKGFVYSDGNYDYVEEITIKDYYKDDKLFEELKKLLTDKLTPQKAAEIQIILSEFNSFNHIYTRTRKRDVLDSNQRIIRKPHKISISLSEKEREIYDYVLQDYQDNEKSHLGLIQHKRMMSSSIETYYSKHRSNLVHLHKPEEDSKFIALKGIIDKIVGAKGKKIIVFSFFTITLDYLEEKLNDLGYSTAVIHGKRKNRFEEIEKFKHSKSINILLASEVGSEGLDLQFSDSLVNYDLPWNPMVVEQRIGRIDRIGQESERINIYNLIIQDSIEEDIYDRLLDRIDLFKESIGDLEVILQEEDSNIFKKLQELEKNLYTTSLTKEERREKISIAKQALESERLTLKKLEEELKESFVNDAHLNNEINKIETEDRYVTEEDLFNITHYLFKKILPNIKFTETEKKHIYKVSWRKNEKEDLFKFLEQNLSPFSKQPELHTILKDFRKKYISGDAITITFNQEISYENKSIEYINAYHPIVDSFKNYCYNKGIGSNQSFSFEISSLDVGVEAGIYLLCSYNLKIDKLNLFGKKTYYTLQENMLFDLNGDEIVEIEHDKVNEIVKVAKTSGSNTSLPINFAEDEDIIELFRSEYTKRAFVNRMKFSEKEELLFSSEMERKYKMEMDMIDIGISKWEETINENSIEVRKKMGAIWNAKIKSLDDKKRDLIKRKLKAFISIEDELIATSIINIL